jgi:uncharacterized membrane protein
MDYNLETKRSALNQMEINRVQNETRVIETKHRIVENNYGKAIEYLFNNLIVIQNQINLTAEIQGK